jgi:hypothetical protein
MTDSFLRVNALIARFGSSAGRLGEQLDVVKRSRRSRPLCLEAKAASAGRWRRGASGASRSFRDSGNRQAVVRKTAALPSRYRRGVF